MRTFPRPRRPKGLPPNRTSIAMRHRLTEFNKRRKLDGKDQIHIGIGINSGS
ncbi:MAG: hypothetical protein HC796_01250, partial [Synechococcaceae cyanobacterium RL_1_2]|nr:hypothetical protein [Synechococcaceae cyanobacterium RL_1_2]